MSCVHSWSPRNNLSYHTNLGLFRFIAGFGVCVTDQMLEGVVQHCKREVSHDAFSCNWWNLIHTVVSPFWSQIPNSCRGRVNGNRTVRQSVELTSCLAGFLAASWYVSLCSLQPVSLVVEGGCHDTQRYGSSEMPRQEVNWTELFGAQTTSDTDTKRGALFLTQHSMGKLLKPLSTFSVSLFKGIGVRFVFVQKELQTVHVCRCRNVVSNVTFLLYDVHGIDGVDSIYPFSLDLFKGQERGITI